MVTTDEHPVDEVSVGHLLVCWQVAWIMMCFIDVKRQQSPAAGPCRFGFVFFRISFQTAYNLYISTVK